MKANWSAKIFSFIAVTSRETTFLGDLSSDLDKATKFMYFQATSDVASTWALFEVKSN